MWELKTVIEIYSTSMNNNSIKISLLLSNGFGKPLCISFFTVCNFKTRPTLCIITLFETKTAATSFIIFGPFKIMRGNVTTENKKAEHEIESLCARNMHKENSVFIYFRVSSLQ